MRNCSILLVLAAHQVIFKAHHPDYTFSAGYFNAAEWRDGVGVSWAPGVQYFGQWQPGRITRCDHL